MVDLLSSGMRGMLNAGHAHRQPHAHSPNGATVRRTTEVRDQCEPQKSLASRHDHAGTPTPCQAGQALWSVCHLFVLQAKPTPEKKETQKRCQPRSASRKQLLP